MALHPFNRVDGEGSQPVNFLKNQQVEAINTVTTEKSVGPTFAVQ